MFAWSDSLRCSRSCGSVLRSTWAGAGEPSLPPEVAQQVLELRDQPFADRAGDADHHARRLVPVVEVLEERLTRRSLDRLARAERLPAERVRAEEELLVH